MAHTMLVVGRMWPHLLIIRLALTLPSMEWPTASDTFLEHHLPGKSEGVTKLRSAIIALNSAFNQSLVRGVRLHGESGSGKNHVAKVVAAHRQWRIAGANSQEVGSLAGYLPDNFAEISLQALPDQLIESELFGHVKGAFTGAIKDKVGLLGGDALDILLDEVGDASPAVQVKLLGVVETGEFRPVGASADAMQRSAARLIFATHRNLAELVRDGTFREDLYWRASEVVIEVPPLRDQLENLPDLIAYQLGQLYALAGYDEESGGLRERPKLSASDLKWAATYRWPGNLRQLRHGLVRWLAVEGSVPLARVVAASESEEPFRMTSGSVVRSAYMDDLAARLEKARTARVPIADTLGDLIDEVRRAAESTIINWHDAVKPSAEELLTLFPLAKRNSISSKLSQWRTQ